MKPIFRQNAAKVKQQYDNKNLKLNIPIGDANGIVMSVWMFAVKPTLVVCKGRIFLKVIFFGLISTTFEFSRQKDMPFFTKIDILPCQIWLKMKF